MLLSGVKERRESVLGIIYTLVAIHRDIIKLGDLLQ